MEVEIERVDHQFQFEATRGDDKMFIAASPQLAGEGAKGLRPMELVLSALGSCMSIDVLNILYKQRQQVDSFRVQVIGERTTTVPSVYSSIEIVLFVTGEVAEAKLARAIKLSEETYCSVHRMLSPTVAITTKYYLNHE